MDESKFIKSDFSVNNFIKKYSSLEELNKMAAAENNDDNTAGLDLEMYEYMKKKKTVTFFKSEALDMETSSDEIDYTQTRRGTKRDYMQMNHEANDDDEYLGVGMISKRDGNDDEFRFHNEDYQRHDTDYKRENEDSNNDYSLSHSGNSNYDHQNIDDNNRDKGDQEDDDEGDDDNEENNEEDEDRMLIVWSLHDTFAKNVPDSLILKYTDSRNLSAGIFTLKDVKRNTVFGPYVGENIYTQDDALDKRYYWDIFTVENRFHHRIDSADAEKSNWMRYINFPLPDQEHNIEAFQYNYRVYFRTTKDIAACNELLVNTSPDYNRDCPDEIINCASTGLNGAMLPNNGLKMAKRMGKNSEGSKKFHCSSCTYVTDIKASFNYHMRMHAGDKPHKCDLCDAAFIFNTDLLRHKRSHTGEKPYECSLCNATFVRSANLRDHQHTHTGEKPFKCEMCSASFTRNRNLRYHIRIHTGEKPYKCDLCNAAFNQNYDLIRHIRIHTGEKPYKCEICNAGFAQSTALKNHLRKHTGERPFKCNLCDATFTIASILRDHMRTHKADKPYKCEVCSCVFTVHSAFQNHVRKHTGNRPFKCEVCNASFAVASILRDHKRTHTGEKPYKCYVCNSVFARNNTLQRHVRTHTGEKPFKCDICNARFSRNNYLQNHIRVHTEDNPHKCDMCDEAFTQSCSLKKHIKEFHQVFTTYPPPHTSSTFDDSLNESFNTCHDPINQSTFSETPVSPNSSLSNHSISDPTPSNHSIINPTSSSQSSSFETTPTTTSSPTLTA